MQPSINGISLSRANQTRKPQKVKNSLAVTPACEVKSSANQYQYSEKKKHGSGVEVISRLTPEKSASGKTFTNDPACATSMQAAKLKPCTSAVSSARWRVMESVSLADTFFSASLKWLKNYEQFIEPRTIKDYRQYCAALASFFGKIPLSEIDHNLIATYQHWRSNRTVSEPEGPDTPEEQREPNYLKASKYRHSAGNSRINGELNSVMKPLLRKVGCWTPIAENYHSLPVSKLGSGRSLQAEDREKLISYCFVRPRWRLAGHCIRLMFRGGFGPGELFRVRRKDIDVDSPKPTISILDGAKCEGDRERTIPLTGTGMESAQWIVARWQDLGGTEPEQFILPHRAESKDGPTDFSRPMGSIKKAWAGIKAYIKKHDPAFYQKIKDFRLYDCRVTAVTEALKSGEVSIHTAKKYFGHVSEAMQRRYYKPHLDTLHDVSRVLEKKPAQSEGTDDPGRRQA